MAVWDSSSKCVVWVSQCLEGDSLPAHLLVYLGNTSLFSEEDFPFSCRAFVKVLIGPLFRAVELAGVVIYKEVWFFVLLQGKLGYHSCSVLFVCFHPSLLAVAFKLVAWSHSLRFPCYFKCYDSI